MEILTLLIYFCVGVVQDFFFTLNTKYVAREKVFLSVIFSFFTVLISMLVLYRILSNVGDPQSVVAIIVYSCGIATGTYIAMKLPGLKK